VGEESKPHHVLCKRFGLPIASGWQGNALMKKSFPFRPLAPESLLSGFSPQPPWGGSTHCPAKKGLFLQARPWGFVFSAEIKSGGNLVDGPHRPSCVSACFLFSCNKKQEGDPMSQRANQQWQPIERLSLVTFQIETLLQAANEQRASLQEAKAHRSLVDDSTLGRVITVFTAQKKDLWLFEEQLQRWRAEDLTMIQRAEIERLTRQMRNLHEGINAVLVLADELKEDTIEKVLQKGDAKRSLEMLIQLWKQEQK